MSEKVEKLIEEVKELTVLELSEVVKALEEEFRLFTDNPFRISNKCNGKKGNRNWQGKL